jgi:hypothetical protein
MENNKTLIKIDRRMRKGKKYSRFTKTLPHDKKKIKATW